MWRAIFSASIRFGIHRPFNNVRAYPLISLLLIGCAGSPIKTPHASLTRKPSATIDTLAQSEVVAAPLGGVTRVPRDVRLEWDPVSDTDDYRIGAYTVYYSIDPDLYNAAVVPLGITTNVVVSNLVSGVEYYFSVSDSTVEGVESDLSPIIPYAPPLRLDLTFVFPAIVSNVVVQATQDLQNWSNIDARETNGVYRIDPDPEIPLAFYRAMGNPEAP
jgi:hypothetical protein